MHTLPSVIGLTARFLMPAIALGTLLAPGSASARIYKCIDAAGHVSYIGRPCPQGAALAGTFDEASWSRPAPRPSRAGTPPTATGSGTADEPVQAPPDATPWKERLSEERLTEGYRSEE